MKTYFDRAALYKFLPTTASMVVIVTGCLVLIGWLFDLPTLQYVLPGLPKMTANTAVAFVLAGLALWLYSTPPPSGAGRDHQRWLAQALTALVTLIGLLTLSEYLFGWDLGLDQLLFKDPLGTVDTSIPGRPSPHTALTFTLVGLSLILLPGDSSPRYWLVQYLILTAAFIALLALVGYGFSVSFLFRISAYTGMALHTALSFIVLCVGLLFLHPDRGFMALMTTGSLGAMMARRLLLFAIGVPVLVGWASLLGERAGLYNTEFEPVLLAVLSAYIFSGVIWWYARSLNQMDAERNRADEALRTSEARYADLYENALDMYITINASGHIIQCNQTLVQMTGFSKAEIIGRPVFERYHPDCLEKVKELFQTFMSTGQVRNAELQLRRKDGSPLDVSLNTSAVRDKDGKILYSRSVWRDITERKQAELALRQSEELFSKAFHSSPAPMTIARQADGAYVEVNQSFLRLVECDRDEVIGHTSLDLNLIDAEERAELIRQARQQKAFRNIETQARTKSGQSINVLISNENIELAGEACVILTMLDITERKRTEEALRQREAHYRTLFEYVPDGILIADLESYYLDANPAMCDMLGYTREELIGLHGSDIVAPQETQRIEPALNQIKTTSDYAETWRFRRKDGSVFLAEVRVTTMSDGNLLAMVHDITERMRVEEESRLKDELLQMTGEMAKVGGWEFDTQTLKGTWTDEVAHIHDLDPGQPTNVELGLSFYPPEYREKIDRAVEEAIEFAKPYDLELEMVSAKGNHKWVRTMALPITDGEKVIKVRGIFQDITERKQAEATLRESEIRFRATFEQAAVGVAHVRPDGRWLRVNQKLCDIVGYSREEMLELSFQDISHPDDLEADLEYVRQVLAGELQTYSLEKRYVRKDGSIVWIDLTVSLVRQPSGEPDYFISVIQDITRRKQLEGQLLQAQKMEAIGQLTAGIAHDFNNLLLVMNGFAELMQLQLAPDDPHQESLDKILHAGQRAADLVRQLLIFSRKQVIEPQYLNLNTTVANMDKMLRRIIGENINLRTSLSPDLGQVKVDPTQIEQVIVNLAVNARDAMPEGGRLTIETTNVLLDDNYIAHHLEAQPGNHILLAVSDTGLGMSEEVKAHIFEPFFTTKEQGKGTGLGLPTVYGIVKQNGGNIWVYSEPGMGTTFKIYLPGAEEGVSSFSHREIEAEMPFGKETILLVEDDDEVRNLVRRVLQAQGYTLLEAERGQEALRIAADHTGPIHLLLTDVIMPGMNGRQLAEELGQLWPGLKTLFMSGYTDDAIAHHGVLDSGVFLLQKPFGSAVLARKVRSVLDS